VSLATRCTSCGTVFRVVQDQLKVSEGWVRCGQCSAVFNALDGLFDLERGPGDNLVEFGVPHGSAVEATTIELKGDDGAGAHDPAPTDANQHGGSITEHTAPAGARTHLIETDPDLDATKEAEPALLASQEGSPYQIGASGETSTGAEPEFVRHAERLSKGTSGLRQALQGSVVVALGIALGLQGAHHFRDEIAARWLRTWPVLAEACAALKCSLEAPRRIDDIAVESSSLTRSEAAPQAFRLAVSLRNRGVTSLSAPSLDLTLTDANGQVVARRILVAGDFRASATPLKAGEEASWQLVMSTGTERVTGYTIEAFYP
jgi:predicted Zn finger-like uncharacterized protein